MAAANNTRYKITLRELTAAVLSPAEFDKRKAAFESALATVFPTSKVFVELITDDAADAYHDAIRGLRIQISKSSTADAGVTFDYVDTEAVDGVRTAFNTAFGIDLDTLILPSESMVAGRALDKILQLEVLYDPSW